MLYSNNKPNKKTKKVFSATDQGKNLTACMNIDDLVEKIEIEEKTIDIIVLERTGSHFDLFE